MQARAPVSVDWFDQGRRAVGTAAVALAVLLTSCSETPRRDSVERGVAAPGDGGTQLDDGTSPSPDGGLTFPDAGLTGADLTFPDAGPGPGPSPDTGAGPPPTGNLIPGHLLPFNQPPLKTLQQSTKKVVAHWFLWPLSKDNKPPPSDRYTQALNSNKPQWDSHLRFRPLPRPPRSAKDWLVEDCKADIRLAQAIGVDAFLVNFGAGGDSQGKWFNKKFSNMLKAAEALKSGFEVVPNLDANIGMGSGPPPVATVVKQLVDGMKAEGVFGSPALMRHQGKVVVGNWMVSRAPGSWWVSLKKELATRGINPFLLCTFNSSAISGSKHSSYDAACDGWGGWGTRDPKGASRDYLKSRGWGAVGSETMMHAINQQDLRYRPGNKTGAEARGSLTLRTNWLSAINTSGVDWAQIVTWNDHGEHGSFVPTTGTQLGFYDLSAYYITWFKTGKQPKIVRDGLYYFHRIYRGPPWHNQFGGGSPAWVNEIELVGFLTAPGTLEIITSQGTTRKNVPAGIQSITAPLPGSGVPRFRLVRGGKAVVDFKSAFTIGTRAGAGLEAIDLVYRSGGSLRTAHGAKHPATACQKQGPDACLSPGLAEPVWMAQ